MEEEMKKSDDQRVTRQPKGCDSTTGVTAEAFKPDTEECVVDQQRWTAVHARRAAGVAISAIAREFELDRKTVRAVLAQEAWQPCR